jgi:hypothetical protein
VEKVMAGTTSGNEKKKRCYCGGLNSSLEVGCVALAGTKKAPLEFQPIVASYDNNTVSKPHTSHMCKWHILT